jgi:hypothetical protein
MGIAYSFDERIIPKTNNFPSEQTFLIEMPAKNAGYSRFLAWLGMEQEYLLHP